MSGKRRVLSLEEKKKIVNEFEKSGLSIEGYAKTCGIPHNTLRTWVYRNRNSGNPASPRKSGPRSVGERKQAVEAYLKSGLTQRDFARTWGVAAPTITKWLKLYETLGMKGLEQSSFQEQPKKRGVKGIATALRDEIINVKRSNPNFGIRKVRDFLMRFRGVKVSTGTINKTNKEENLPNVPVTRRRRRNSDQVRRFERATAMQLWQSDITSFVLPRHSQRFYLTVFLDDYSRYIVAWNVQLRQTQDLVTQALLSGIEKFGKPQEVLTDQGRQYFSWRGKSDFQKQLDKQGIRHVVSRSHHPETLGKCERLWETINKELFDRVRPETLDEAEQRLSHFFNHYNHFRPHQGIEGLTPADRFFGVASEVRKALEESFTKNEIRLATGEKPRSPVFLIGQIGDQPISMHGESGKLVVQTSNGEIQKMNYENFGQMKGDQNNEKLRAKAEETTRQEKANTTQDAGTSGENTMGERNIGTEGESTLSGSSGSGMLDRANYEGGRGEAAGNPTPQNVAAVTTSNFGYASRTTSTAKDESQRSNYGSERGPESIEKEDRGTGNSGEEAKHIDRSHAFDAGVQGSTSPGLSTTENHSRREECEKNKEEEDSHDTDGSSQ